MMAGVEFDDGDDEEIKIEYTDVISDNAVYPNPATDFICFHLPANSEKEITISITDISGRECLTLKKNTSNPCFEIPSELNNGMYFFSIIGNSSNQEMLKGKFIVQN